MSLPRLQVALARARSWLGSVRNGDGSWGYLPCRQGQVEPTLLAVAAGLDVPLPWLRQHRDRFRRQLPLVLWGHPGADTLVREALDWLEQDRAEVLMGIPGFDASIPAWGWVPDTAAWVEPTAHAILSLRKGGRGGSPRVQDGLLFLRDRQDEDGGWNFGNPRILGSDLESFPGSTGWALLALQGLPGVEEAVDKGLRWMSVCLEQPTSQGSALLAFGLAVHGRDPTPALLRLTQRQQEDGSFYGRVDTTALAAGALALGVERHHAFQL